VVRLPVVRLMEPFTRVGVTVTFLRMDRGPTEPAPALPPGFDLVRVAACSVAFYRYLYDTVGADYVWWLRRTMPDAELTALLAHPQVSIHVLYSGGEPAGFFELDGRGWPDMNLSYFGLMPRAGAHGAAIAEGWRRQPRGMTVNTCTADHKRALPTYLKAGFRPVRQVREIWNVPVRLGLRIPDALKV
jgi:hypothetical protein